MTRVETMVFRLVNPPSIAEALLNMVLALAILDCMISPAALSPSGTISTPRDLKASFLGIGSLQNDSCTGFGSFVPKTTDLEEFISWPVSCSHSFVIPSTAPRLLVSSPRA